MLRADLNDKREANVTKADISYNSYGFTLLTNLFAAGNFF